MDSTLKELVRTEIAILFWIQNNLDVDLLSSRSGSKNQLVGQPSIAIRSLSAQMSWSYRIDAERGLVITTAWGVVDAAQALEHQSQLRSDAAFNPDFFQFVDFTGVTELEMDLATVIKLADANIFSGKSRRAFLAGANLLVYGMCRMFISFHGPIGEDQMRAFTDRNEAMQWVERGDI